MEAKTRKTRLGWNAYLLVLLAFLPWGRMAWAQSPHVELVLEQNPPEGGLVTPGSGIHQFTPDSRISVTAVPQPGYRFAYWLGDVSDPSSSTTEITLSDSKAVVAVFEQVMPVMVGEDDEERERDWIGAGGGGGFSGASPSAPDFFTTSWSIGGGGARQPQSMAAPVLIQTPEPTTLLLFGLGGSFLVQQRKKRHQRR